MKMRFDVSRRGFGRLMGARLEHYPISHGHILQQ